MIDLIATPGLTAAERTRLTAPYVGQWLEIDGIVDDVHGNRNNAQVHFKRAMNLLGIMDAIATFAGGPDSEKALGIRKGMRIRVRGQITRISSGWGVELNSSEIK